MINAYQGKTPRFGEGVRIHETAVVIGDVELGAGVSLWPHSVLRGDYNAIRIGSGSNVQDGAVLHNDFGHPLSVGGDCVIGHLACVHGCTVGDRCLIGIHAVVLNGAVIGAESVIGAGAVVPENAVIPPRSLVLGVPGRVIRQVTDEELKRTLDGAANYRGFAARELPLAGA
ncbi:MAG: gamma carbonic anhydrase family protein [candidate division FCPU426 bacterium]